ncbi:hypothetical protein DFJ77DRAFT_540062 [Powellomyces hirtus]|nr:hypothetical protein DFJ77DRAFT_540062 [Powellomyces hirtus]
MSDVGSPKKTDGEHAAERRHEINRPGFKVQNDKMEARYTNNVPSKMVNTDAWEEINEGRVEMYKHSRSTGRARPGPVVGAQYLHMLGRSPVSEPDANAGSSWGTVTLDWCRTARDRQIAQRIGVANCSADSGSNPQKRPRPLKTLIEDGGNMNIDMTARTRCVSFRRTLRWKSTVEPCIAHWGMEGLMCSTHVHQIELVIGFATSIKASHFETLFDVPSGVAVAFKKVLLRHALRDKLPAEAIVRIAELDPTVLSYRHGGVELDEQWDHLFVED